MENTTGTGTEATVKQKESWFYYFAIAVLKIWYAIMFKVEVIGRENIPKEGNGVICCNHYSNYDPFSVVLYIDRLPRYIAKKELFDIPIYKWMLEQVKAFPVDRKAAMDMKALKSGLKVLKEGELLGIFAEGTRVKEGEKGDVKGGVAMFAMKGNAPVIPCAISGSYKFRSKLRIEFGQPMTLEEYRTQKLTADTIEEIAGKIMGRVEEMKVKV